MSKPALTDRMLTSLSSLERLVLTPLIAWKRSRGWKRRGLAVLYLTITGVVGAIAWREASLWHLPNAPEPFDLVKYGRVEVPDADNAIVAYRSVVARFGDLGSTKGYSVADARAWTESDWSAADPEVRRWAEDHREAREAWLPANDRPDALLVQPEDWRMSTLIDPLQSLHAYVRLALLEGSRLEQSGDLAGAWRMYRAALRASRHAARHGGTIQRLIGNAILKQSRARIEPWIDRPGMTAELLRRAIGDVEACRAMTSPASETVRAEYFSARAAVYDTETWSKLSDSGPYSNTHWYNQFDLCRWTHRFLRREPERSARVLRLIAAGYLAQCDRPRADRPKLVFPDSMIYDHDARTPPSVRAISPDALESWSRDSIVFVLGPFSDTLQRHLDAEAGTFDHLTLKMAERAFEIDHSRPARTYGELLGGYLKALPEGIEPQDLLNPGSE
jgi:hypothetical protein